METLRQGDCARGPHSASAPVVGRRRVPDDTPSSAIRPPTDDVWLLVPPFPVYNLPSFAWLWTCFDCRHSDEVKRVLLWEQVLRATRDPVTICNAARVCHDWYRLAQEPAVWAEADVGATVRRYVMYHRCLDRDKAVVQAGRNALQRLKSFRAFTSWRHMTIHTGDRKASVPLGMLESVWAPPSSRAEREDAGYGSWWDTVERVPMVKQVFLDTATRTLGYLVQHVLAKNVGFQVPNVSCGHTELVYGTEAEFDADEGDGAYARSLSKTLADWGVTDGVRLDVDDDASDARLSLIIHTCLSDQENSNPTTTASMRLGFHRVCGRTAVNSKRQSHCFEMVPPWPRGLPVPPQRDLPSMYFTPVYSTPEDAVFEQDPESQRLADVALRRCTGAQGGRLSQLHSLDLSGLGVSVSLLALVCNAARKSKSLKRVTLDQCAMLDYPRDNEQAKSRVVYNELRVALSTDGVSISDKSDTLSIKVVDESGTAVYFKQQGRRRLKTLFVVYSVRQRGEYVFYYKHRNADGEEASVQLQASDSPHRIGMVSHLGDLGEDDTRSDGGESPIVILAQRQPFAY